MRVMWVAGLLFASLLAGCSDQGTPEPVVDDIDVEVTDSTGAIVCVVVDEAIRPIQGAKVTATSAGEALEAETDEEGMCIFEGVAPGTWFLEVKHGLFAPAQSSTDVVAGVEPPVLKLQLTRLFEQDPFTEQIKFQGYMACSYSAVLITAPCITDYTSILVPGGAANQLRDVQGDNRAYEATVGQGWQSLIFEMTWNPSAQGTSENFGMTISHSQRTSSHWFASFGGPNPMRGEIKVGEVHPSHQSDPNAIPEEGIPDLYVFMNVRRPEGEYVALALSQEVEAFQTNFYYGVPPEGWSFVNGDPLPF